jgi:FkbM family methyltransferase
LTVFAVEPNLRAAAKLAGAAPNYFVVPFAIAERDGCSEFQVNTFEASSSLLPLNEEGSSANGSHTFIVSETIVVPTLRLDTLMNLAGIEKVDFLKIDAQGMDLAVVKSAGDRLEDIAKITLEVWVGPHPQYRGVATKEEVLRYLNDHGFSLQATQVQTEGNEENLTFVRKSTSTKLART